MLSGATHFRGNLMLELLSCRKYSFVPMLSESPKSATLMTKLTSILHVHKDKKKLVLVTFQIYIAYMQFLAAKSLCTTFISARYFIPLATWMHISINRLFTFFTYKVHNSIIIIVVTSCTLGISIPLPLHQKKWLRNSYSSLSKQEDCH